MSSSTKRRGPLKRTSAKSVSRTDEVLNLAADFLDACNPRAAQLIYEEALAATPDDAILLDALGEVLYELGDEDEAKARFLRSAELSPGGGHAKWVHLGTMSEGHEAVGYFRRGISLLESRVIAATAAARASFSSSSESIEMLRRSLSNAYCAIAEIYMSDLCDEPEAEREAESSAASAVASDEQNPDAHAVFASVRLSQQRPIEASVMLKKASALLEALCREMEEDMLKEDDHDDHDARGGEMIKMKMEEEVEDTSSSSTLNVNGGGSSTSKELAVAQSAALMPAYQSRLSLAKMCMEVELWSEACDILDRLIAENDTVMEVWFLLGEAQLHSLDMSSAFDTVSTAAAIVSAAISSLGGGRGGGGGGDRKKKVGGSTSKIKSATKGGFGEGAAVRSATADAIQNAPLEFSREVIEALLSTPLEELDAQFSQFSSLLETIKSRMTTDEVMT